MIREESEWETCKPCRDMEDWRDMEHWREIDEPELRDPSPQELAADGEASLRRIQAIAAEPIN